MRASREHVAIKGDGADAKANLLDVFWALHF
jgi:hypothetical protein